MKKTIITGILFLAIVSISAQEKGTKNTKPIKYTKGTNSSVIVEKEVKTEKTTPVSIRPTSSNSTNRAAQTTIQTNRPEKVSNNRAASSSAVNTTRPEKATNNRAAASSAVNTSKAEKVSNNRAASSSAVNTSKAEKVSNNRAASSSAVNTSKAEKATNNRAASSSAVNTSKAEKVTNNSKADKTEKALTEEFRRSTIEFCRGWKEGYMKAWTRAHKGEKLETIPNCVVLTSDCKDYKCGYKAGKIQAEIDIR